MHVIYSSAAIFLVNYVWFILWTGYSWEDFWVFGKQIIISEYIVFVIITSIIYAISFFKAWKGKWQEAEQLKIEALLLKYQVLQNQVNPHFLFNSLNVLGSLIDIDVDKAKTFARELSMFYRDVLHFKDMELVSLKDEIEFVKKYIYLQEIRFGEAFSVEFCISPKIEASVIPLSLQMLVENAIKHNEMSALNPLKIVIAITDDYKLIIENNLQLRKAADSSRKGLKNLAGRYEFLTGEKVVVVNDGNYFRVTLPLIRTENLTGKVWD
jgi:LytS/YehU family sensor histidine kinase